MFDWDNMQIKKPRSAEQLYAEVQKKKRIIKPISKLIAGRPEPIVTQSDEH